MTQPHMQNGAVYPALQIHRPLDDVIVGLGEVEAFETGHCSFCTLYPTQFFTLQESFGILVGRSNHRLTISNYHPHVDLDMIDTNPMEIDIEDNPWSANLEKNSGGV
ncbi:hypothetical protein FF2_033627 [Malus domestica]